MNLLNVGSFILLKHYLIYFKLIMQVDQFEEGYDNEMYLRILHIYNNAIKPQLSYIIYRVCFIP